MPHQFISKGLNPFDFDFLLFYLLNLSLEGVEERFYELSWVESLKLKSEALQIEDFDF